MKQLLLYLFASIFLIAPSIASGSVTLQGKVTDKATGEGLPGVEIYFPDLKKGTTTDIDGIYTIENLPVTKALIQVSFIGYKLIAETIDLATTTTKDFMLEEAVMELNEVVVTGLSKSAEKRRTPTPITTISTAELRALNASNIIDAIASRPGIDQVTTGPGISKPVIRGLGFNRVVVVNDGIRQEGQQWGDEHGIEIDEYGVNRVEILKGPASLAFGSDAMAGVINFLPAPTLPKGKISGSVLANYQTNAGLIGGSADLAGNINDYIWDVRYSGKESHAYQNAYDGYVFNSGFKENNLSGILGVIKSWGYSNIHFSVYDMTPGIVEGERDSASGKFIKPFAIGGEEGEAIATEDDFRSYTPQVPFQKIHHYKAVSNSSFVLGNGSLKTILGWQQNRRQEYGEILTPDEYGLYFFLNTVNYDVRYNLPELNKWNISVGANGMYQKSQNKGTEFLIPDYHLFDFGIFALARKSFEKLDVSGGLRFDTRQEKADALYLDAFGERTDHPDGDSFLQFSDIDAQFQGFSGSIGATYQFSEQVFAKLNLSKGFRTPNIAEISANGVHEGTVNYIIGVPTLKAESSWQWDFALGVNSHYITAELDLFSNKINNYIYLEKLSRSMGGDSLTDGYATYKYTSGDAHLYGGELSIDVHPAPIDWLHFENGFSWVRAVQADQPDSTRNLPFTPSPKLTSELKANVKKIGKNLVNGFFMIGVDNYFRQDHFYSAYGTETATPGYTLLNVGLGADFVSNNRTLFSLFINANNLTDVAYQNHLSRLKYEAVNNVTGRMGVYNMGRNVSVKLVVPIQVKG
ncbi:MAG: TonB-dependent receptor [Lewinellaceae bacterium]|nr:TonB-dependent receptor [Saprospiraceae bacterium]MCB9270499.1 TonB-dependent receptor [Lewinellaceae bacterium]HQU51820.1 TonB-dependent receptor [Saprospiraceae bacterium]